MNEIRPQPLTSAAFLFSVAIALALTTLELHAQVPQLINYQGRIVSGSTNFNGMGQFKFALIDTDSTGTVWSNDGTSTQGSQPTNAVSISVTNGLYSVLLGNTATTNMHAIPAGVFSNSTNVVLRVWFNDGPNGFQQLSPDQQVAAVGYAMVAATISSDVNSNTASGTGALSQSVGSNNTATGYSALHTTSGSYNTADGLNALSVNTTGIFNTTAGAYSLQSNTTGSANAASGAEALTNNISGNYNTASGYAAIAYNTGGSRNTATGYEALYNSTASDNTALGYEAGANITSGSSNIMIGSSAGQNIMSGSNDIDIGNAGFSNESNAIRIGSSQTTAAIAGISGASIGTASPVYVNSGGRLGTIASSQRFKRDVVDMAEASDELLSLRPVTFRYKPEYDEAGLQQFGLIAEEVEKVDPDLIVRDKEGKPYSVRYEQINAMLLNEFLKEHKALVQLEATNSRQEQRIEELAAAVTTQAAELARVGAQVRDNRSGKEVAGGNQ